MKTNINFLLYFAQLFLKREMFQINVAEKIKTHILCSTIFFFSKIVQFVRQCGKILWCLTGQ
jgi:hypothetical protein